MKDSYNPESAVRASSAVVHPGAVIPWTETGAGSESAEIFEAVLEGGPDTMPVDLRRQWVSRRVEKIKVCHYGGYEHFDRDLTAETIGTLVSYRWTGRTRIAE